MRERRLLGELVRTAYDVTRRFLAAQFPGVKRAVPYFVGAVETWGSVVNPHPHVHALCSEGVLDREGQYHALPAGFDWSPHEELWRQAVLAMLVEEERLSETTREAFLSWRHSGFSADASTGAAQGDREGLYRLVCYLHKPVLSLGRMEYAPGASKVVYHGKNEAAPGRGTVIYEPVEFMALLLAHVPEPHEIRLRYYGAASSTIRRGGRMKIISFITNVEVIERILRHRGEWGPRGERSPPQGNGAAAAPRERRVVVDEYAQEFPCDPDHGGARRRRGEVERVEREWDWGA